MLVSLIFAGKPSAVLFAESTVKFQVARLAELTQRKVNSAARAENTAASVIKAQAKIVADLITSRRSPGRTIVAQDEGFRQARY